MKSYFKKLLIKSPLAILFSLELVLWKLLHPLNVFAQVTNPVLDPLYGKNIDNAESGALLKTLISAVLGFVMMIGVLMVFSNLIQGALVWIGSGGDSTKLQKARDQITHAVVGVIILSSSFALWNLIKDVLGVDLDFALLFPENTKVN